MDALKLFECKPLHAKISLAMCEENRRKAHSKRKSEETNMGPCKNCTLWQEADALPYTPVPKPEYIPKPMPEPEVLHVPFVRQAEEKAGVAKESEIMEETREKRTHRKHSEETKKAAVAELFSGKTWNEVSGKYRVSHGTLATWRKNYMLTVDVVKNSQSLVDMQNDKAEHTELSAQMTKIQEDMQEIMLMIRNLAKIAKAVNQAITTL